MDAPFRAGRAMSMPTTSGQGRRCAGDWSAWRCIAAIGVAQGPPFSAFRARDLGPRVRHAGRGAGSPEANPWLRNRRSPRPRPTSRTCAPPGTACSPRTLNRNRQLLRSGAPPPQTGRSAAGRPGIRRRPRQSVQRPSCRRECQQSTRRNSRSRRSARWSRNSARHWNRRVAVGAARRPPPPAAGVVATPYALPSGVRAGACCDQCCPPRSRDGAAHN